MIFLILQRLFFLLVVIKTLLLIKWAILRAFRRLPSPTHMISRYGKDSWVAVTGATDGIGKGFCEVLASLKMNIILISRNIKKLNYVAQNLEGEFGIQTKVVQCDFADSLQNGFFERIMKQIDHLDISIWVNNVGIAKYGQFHEIDK